VQISPSTVEPADWRQFIGHREWVPASATLEAVQKQFAGHEYEFMLVLDGERLVGLCARTKIGMLLGARFGFALYSPRPVREALLAEVTCIRVNQPLADVLACTCSRPDASLYDDVVLLDDADAVLGVIYSRTLVRLQHWFLQEKNQQLEAQQHELNSKNAQMEGDLALAREIQLAMLPAQLPDVVGPGPAPTRAIRFQHRYESAGLVSGDFFHALKISESATGILICDVMGHGVRAAFVTAMLRALVEEMRTVGDNPGELLTRLNTELLRILKPRENLLYATAGYLVVDAGQKHVQYASAGHPCPLLLHRPTGAVEPLRSDAGAQGPVLGLLGDARYVTTQRPWEADELILLYTDGIYEVLDSAGAEFGSAKLAAALRHRRELPLEALLDGLLTEARNHSATRCFDDDVCLIALEAGGL